VLSEPINYGALAKHLRTVLGFTQSKLASEMQVSFGTVSGWENGKHAPIPALASRLIDMARTAGIDPYKPGSSTGREGKRSLAAGRRRSGNARR
jgi:transcriptional regulator with XRE-family HTH domain